MFWGNKELKCRLPNIVTDYVEARLDRAAYKLRVGPEVYVSPTGVGSDQKNKTKLKLDLGRDFVIPAGQFAFLLTEETVTVPEDALAFISIRAKYKFRGLVKCRLSRRSRLYRQARLLRLQCRPGRGASRALRRVFPHLVRRLARSRTDGTQGRLSEHPARNHKSDRRRDSVVFWPRRQDHRDGQAARRQGDGGRAGAGRNKMGDGAPGRRIHQPWAPRMQFQRPDGADHRAPGCEHACSWTCHAILAATAARVDSSSEPCAAGPRAFA
jgi:hypothetical protein